MVKEVAIVIHVLMLLLYDRAKFRAIEFRATGRGVMELREIQ